jgi:hypothetical protein
MFVDARTLPEGASLKADICIIGFDSPTMTIVAPALQPSDHLTSPYLASLLLRGNAR